MQVLHPLLSLLLLISSVVYTTPLHAASSDARPELLTAGKAHIFEQFTDLLFVAFQEFFKVDSTKFNDFRRNCMLEFYKEYYHKVSMSRYPFSLISEQRAPGMVRHKLILHKQPKEGDTFREFTIFDAVGHSGNPCLLPSLIEKIHAMYEKSQAYVSMFDRAECRYYNQIMKCFNFLIGTDVLTHVIYLPAASPLSSDDAMLLRPCASAPSGLAAHRQVTRGNRGVSDASYFSVLPHMLAAAAVDAAVAARCATPMPSAPAAMPADAAAEALPVQSGYDTDDFDLTSVDGLDSKHDDDDGSTRLFRPIATAGKAGQNDPIDWSFKRSEGDD
jgi:hypothetical protein